ncbi:hypothetical protein [Melittangium boletus]|uniref:Uncharacterized protein n=1 Tax=Melittangium boletus DSM 14713 TaxID=1294270 RepID=A0A250IT20_9BACT|nr:hypothetical protein [Melittangium boletus]ATB34327.1 hypothetical protein MEBOL_007828 [Melittangium boletus DSM 14713]
MLRFTALVFALLVWVQAALPGGVERVCRYSGRRVAPCASCPEKEQLQDARLLAQDCCELRQGHPVDLGGVLPTPLDAPSQVYWVALPGEAEWTVPVLLAQPGPRIRAGHDPPPRERLFLSLRQLLI